MEWTAWARRIVAGSASDRADMPDLALGHQFRHRADGVLDGRIRADAVLVVEVE
jgi:hypothetical protein